MKNTMKKLSLTRETIVDLGNFRVSGGAATAKPTVCRACGEVPTETQTTTTFGLCGTLLCTQN